MSDFEIKQNKLHPRVDDVEDNASPKKVLHVEESGVASQVASHYNNLGGSKETRKDSRIFFMRNFNNWIKSVLIGEYIRPLKRSPQTDRGKLTVLDLACGKGGDLLKWKKAGVHHVIGVDIAQTSIEQAKERYRSMEKSGRLFSSEFYALDCTRGDARQLYANRDIKFDLVSCQFAFHYCFESLAQAETMLANATTNLRPGGFFIGTMPCAYEIMARRRRAATKPSEHQNGKSFGNSVYRITFNDEGSKNLAWEPELFGCQYLFYLDGCVDCPEFLVYFPLFEKLAAKFGLRLVLKRNFADFFKDNKNISEYENLLCRMRALETFPNKPNESLVGSEDQYRPAQRATLEDSHNIDENRSCGTITKDEWEALTLYTVFAFEKITEDGRAAATENVS